MPFGQIVIGPPGSGKTTYCHGMSHFFELIGRKTAVINLDPANDSLPYECAVNIEELIKLEDVMAQHDLGPNGGLVYCMDYLEKNIDWLKAKLEPLKDCYLLFDFPGQVELFTLHNNAKNVITEMTRKWDYRVGLLFKQYVSADFAVVAVSESIQKRRVELYFVISKSLTKLTAVHLVDAHLCSDPGKYVGALLLSLSAMLHLELPHINVLSKIDLIESYGQLAFNLDFYTDVQDLQYLQYHLSEDPRAAKYKKLTKNLCEVIEDFGLVNFTTLNIQDKESVMDLVKLVDKSNGYVFAGIEGNISSYMKIAAGPTNWDYYRTAAVQEKYMKDDGLLDTNRGSPS